MMKMDETKKKRTSYCSIVEFEQDFFPRSFSEKQIEKPTDNRSIGINLAKESFREIRQKVTEEEIPTIN